MAISTIHSYTTAYQMKTAVITGLAGQDGFYLARLLLEKGYKVVGFLRLADWHLVEGVVRDLEALQTSTRLLEFVDCDLTDAQRIQALLAGLKPSEIYHFAGQSSVTVSFEKPEETFEAIGGGCLRLLEAIRVLKLDCRFVNASSAEIFGRSAQSPQREVTPIIPISPYGCAKAFAHHTTACYRLRGLHASNAILYSHESIRRSPTFFSRKVTQTAARIFLGKEVCLNVGNIDSPRTWGWAEEFVEGMWLMTQQDFADDYILSATETRTARQFIEECFNLLGLSVDQHCRIDTSLYRPTDSKFQIGDISRARDKMGWAPRVSFSQMVERMLLNDLIIEGYSQGELPRTFESK